MIQLASEPNASPPAWRNTQAAGAGRPADARQGRGHRWPFISTHGEKPAAQEPPKDTHGGSGS